jgi:translocator protein
MKDSKLSNGLKLIISIVVCQLAGGIGAIFTTPSISTWYKTLEKPSFSPPNWVFAPVWTTLFLLMGISAFLIWREGIKKSQVRIALGIFITQLLLNILWSLLFFGLKLPMAGFFEIIFLWIAILLTILSFLKISIPAGILLIPYIFWVSLASVLNFALWKLNP